MRSAIRRFFGAVTEAQTYRNVVYLLLGLPMGTLWFTLIVTLFTVSASLVVVALVGVPMLLVSWYVVHGLAAVDRTVAVELLRLDVAPLAPMPTGSTGLWRRLRHVSTDRRLWRKLGYLLLRFPAGIATFTIAVALPTVAAAVAYTPFYLWLDADGWGEWPLSRSLERMGSKWPWSWALVPAGALLAVGSLHIMNAVARSCGRWTSRALSE